MLGTKRNPSFFNDSVEKEEIPEVRHKVKKEDKNNFFDDYEEPNNNDYYEEETIKSQKARTHQSSSFYDEIDDDDFDPYEETRPQTIRIKKENIDDEDGGYYEIEPPKSRQRKSYDEEPSPKRRTQSYDDYEEGEYVIQVPKPRKKRVQDDDYEEFEEEIEPKKVRLKTDKPKEINPTTQPKPPQNQRLGMENRNHTMFHKATQKELFSDIVKKVQAHISNDYAELITGNATDSKEQMKRYIGKYIFDNQLAVEGKTTDQLIADIYTEMAEFGFLTKYIYGTGIEEIDINSWQDIEIQYSNGTTKKIDEHFDSPEHAVNVIRRMLHISGIVLDNASPVVLGHLSKNIRIAVMKYPIVDEDIGIAASIRIVNPQSMLKQDFVNSGTATDKMLDFLSVCIRYGVSICVAGATSSGKTTALGWLLTTIPNSKRAYTIENGSRELDLVKFNDYGKVVNSVIHTLTRDSDNDKQKVDQIALLDVALRFNPDIIVVGEMRGPEANAAQEAARTGVAVLTTIHSNSCESTYRRMVSLCKRAVDMSDNTLMDYVTEAYPIVVFCKQLENKQRRMMEIMECEILDDGTRKYRTLFQYVITENKIEDGEFIVEGHHQQINDISDKLAKRLLENGMPINEIEKLRERE